MNENPMSNAEIFDAFMMKRGGRLPREILPVNVQASYARVVEIAESLINSARNLHPRLPEIHFDFVHNESTNAFAFKTENKYFIGMTTGTIYTLTVIIMRMLADSRVFTGLGEACKERDDLPNIENYTPRAEHLYQRGILPVSPLTEARKDYAFFLRHQALLFLVGHEIAHISQGHLDLLKTETNTASLVEMGWNSEDQREIIERQCLEIMADTRSIRSRICSLKINHDLKEFSNEGWASNLDNEATLFFHWSVAANIIFGLFGDTRLNLSSLPTASYPPLPFRRVLAEASTVGTVTTSWNPALEPVARYAFQRGWHHVETAFSLILGQERTMDRVQITSIDEGNEHIQRLTNVHKELRDRLSRYSFEEDGPPAN